MNTSLTTNPFTISPEKHVIFCIIGVLFFTAQFLRTKQWYQLVMAIAIPLTLLIYLNPENDTLFYGIGILEVCLLVLAFVLNIVQSRRAAKEKAAKEAAEKAAKESAEQPAEKAEETAAETEVPAEAETAEPASETEQPETAAPAAETEE